MKANYETKKDTMYTAREAIIAALANEENRVEFIDALYAQVAADNRTLTPDGRRAFTIAWLQAASKADEKMAGIHEDEETIKFVIKNITDPVCDRIEKNADKTEAAKILKNATRKGPMKILVKISNAAIRIIKKLFNLICKFFKAVGTAIAQAGHWIRDRFTDVEAWLYNHKFIAYIVDFAKGFAFSYGLGKLAIAVCSKLGFTGWAAIGLYAAAAVLAIGTGRLIDVLSARIRTWADRVKNHPAYSKFPGEEYLYEVSFDDDGHVVSINDCPAN